jgi:hypothetical protein
MKIRAWSFLSLVLFGAPIAQAADRYVDAANVNPQWPYTNWAQAAVRVQDAIDAAVSGETIWVRPGTYNTGGRVRPGGSLTNRLMIVKSIKLISTDGAAATVILGKDHGPGATLNCGPSAVRCLAITASNATVQGFTFAEGHTDTNLTENMGGGVYVVTSATNVQFNDCIVRNCAAWQEGGGARGGVWRRSTFHSCTSWNGGGVSAAILYNCVMSNNTAKSEGGGLMSCQAERCSISHNGASVRGGGARGSWLSRCDLIGNDSWQFAGLYGCFATSCVVVSNSALLGGGAGYSWLINCTVVGNTAATGGGVYASSLTNCIVYYNVASNAHPNADPTSTGRYNCIVLSPGMSWNNTITNDPRFVVGSYHLRFSSPCVNTGTNLAGFATSYDRDGRARVLYGRVDLGAYETAAPLNDYLGLGGTQITGYRQSGVNWELRIDGYPGVVATQCWYQGVVMCPGHYDSQPFSDIVVYYEPLGGWSRYPFKDWFQWGGPGMKSVWGDYNADGISDLALFQISSGLWYIYVIGDTSYVAAWGLSWGYSGTVPVPGDYDGDGKFDLAVYDRMTGQWYIRTLAGKVLAWRISWGFAGAVPVSGDYDGDGIYDLAVYDKGTGNWFVRALTGRVLAWRRNWGYAGALPVPGDYDGDGVFDLAVWDGAQGRWYVQSWSGSTLKWRYAFVGTPAGLVSW